MKNILFTISVFLVFISGCASVEVLSLHDPRLPLAARSWLADAEDEVDIAEAHYSDLQQRFRQLANYMNDMEQRVSRTWPKKSKKGVEQGKKAATALMHYKEELLRLTRMEVHVAKMELDLASLRLTLARAETAVRHDLAVHDIEPMLRDIDELKIDIGMYKRKTEEQRAMLDKSSNSFWIAFRLFVKHGGITNALWQSPEIN